MIFLLGLIFLFGLTEDPSGSWKGNLSVQGTELPIVFHITKSESGYTSKMDSPNQGAYGINATSTKFENGTLTISFSNMMATFTGKVENGNLKGTWSQGGTGLPLQLEKFDIDTDQKKNTKIPNFNSDFTGDWSGTLDVGSASMKLILHVEETKVTLDSPDQGAYGFISNKITFDDKNGSFEFNGIGAELRLKIKGKSLTGTFLQAGQSFPISFIK